MCGPAYPNDSMTNSEAVVDDQLTVATARTEIEGRCLRTIALVYRVSAAVGGWRFSHPQADAKKL